MVLPYVCQASPFFFWLLLCLHSFCSDGILWLVSSLFPIIPHCCSLATHGVLSELTTGAWWAQTVFFWYHRPSWLSGLWHAFRYPPQELWPLALPVWVTSWIKGSFWTYRYYLWFYSMNLFLGFGLIFRNMVLKSNSLLELPKELCKIWLLRVHSRWMKSEFLGRYRH